HGGGDRHFHRTAERHPSFELAGNIFGEEVSVEFRALDFMDEDFHFLVRNLLELLFQLCDFLAASADDDSGTGGMNGDNGPFRRTVDEDPRDSGFLQPVLNILPDLEVLLEFSCKILLVVPVGIPGPEDPKAKTDRMYFLSQVCSYVFLTAGFAAAFPDAFE